MNEDEDPSDDLYNHWESIISEADIREVPFKFLKGISVKMIDGSDISFDFLELLAEGMSLRDIEIHVYDFVEDNDEDIDTFDFLINVEALAKDVSKKTRGLLG